MAATDSENPGTVCTLAPCSSAIWRQLEPSVWAAERPLMSAMPEMPVSSARVMTTG